MVADSGKIDAISGVSTQTPPVTAPSMQEGGAAQVQQPAVKHIDFTDAKAAPAASATPSIPAGLSYTHTPYHNNYIINPNGDGYNFGLCKNNMKAAEKGIKTNIEYMTVSAMSQKAKPVVSVINDDFGFGSKNNYAVANCNISLQDLKSSEGINRYFSVLAMPSSHGRTFRASTKNEPMYTLVVTNRETGKVLSGNELDNFYKFAEQTIQVENNAQQSA